MPRLPGKYEVVVEGNTQYGPIETKSVVQVNNVDIELVREFNKVQFDYWKSEGAQLLDSEQEVLKSISYNKEIPTPALRYWGIALIAAATEWTIRRSRGLI